MNTEQSIKAYLDSLSQLPGSILFRNKLQWQALAPGNEGEILTLDSELLPIWKWYRTYYPALMLYDGSTGYYDHTSFSCSNSPWTFTCRFRHRDTVTTRYILWLQLPSRAYFFAFIDTGHRFRIHGYDSSNNLYIRVRNDKKIDDDQLHTVFADYDPTTANMNMIVDGVEARDTTWTSEILQTATLPSGAGVYARIGLELAGANPWQDELGLIGWRNVGGLNYSDHFYADGSIKPIDRSTWNAWMGQPLIFHESGKFDENRGTIGAFTKHGGITLTDPLVWS